MRRVAAQWLRTKPYRLWVAATCAEARRLANREGPSSGLIVDHLLPDGLGLDLIGDLRELHPGVPALLVTGELSRRLANACSRDGIWYVVKPFGFDDFESFFAEVRRFELELRPESAAALAKAIGATKREAQLLLLAIEQGHSRREIARELGIGLDTVKTHVRNILGKTNASSIRELRDRLRQ